MSRTTREINWRWIEIKRRQLESARFDAAVHGKKLKAPPIPSQVRPREHKIDEKVEKKLDAAIEGIIYGKHKNKHRR